MIRFVDAADVNRLLDLETVTDAVERAFRLAGEGRAFDGSRTHVGVDGGTFHVVVGGLRFSDRPIVVAKVNGRFEPATPGGGQRVKGALLVMDATDGKPLALIESGPLTVLRTAGVAAVAARHLARRSARTLLVHGTGRVAVAATRAIVRACSITEVLVASREPERAERFLGGLAADGIAGSVAARADSRRADVILTATPATAPLLDAATIREGTTILAFGGDEPRKQELPADLVASSVVITDSTLQCAVSGELAHAIRAGLMQESDVRAELGAVVAGMAAGRLDDDEVIVFDSTGTAIADAAAAHALLARQTSS